VPAPVDLICVSRDHYRGRARNADGSGHFTWYERQWAYCAAGKAEELHIWKATGGLAVDQLDHSKDWVRSNGSDDEH
jgi:hypothetical protein